MTDILITISATVALSLAISWATQKLGVREYVVKSATMAAQEMILHDLMCSRRALDRDRSKTRS